MAHSKGGEFGRSPYQGLRYVGLGAEEVEVFLNSRLWAASCRKGEILLVCSEVMGAVLFWDWEGNG